MSSRPLIPGCSASIWSIDTRGSAAADFPPAGAGAVPAHDAPFPPRRASRRVLRVVLSCPPRWLARGSLPTNVRVPKGHRKHSCYSPLDAFDAVIDRRAGIRVLLNPCLDGGRSPRCRQPRISLSSLGVASQCLALACAAFRLSFREPANLRPTCWRRAGKTRATRTPHTCALDPRSIHAARRRQPAARPAICADAHIACRKCGRASALIVSRSRGGSLCALRSQTPCAGRQVH